MSGGPLLVTYAVEEVGRKMIDEALRGAAEVVYLTELDEHARADALRNAEVVLARNTSVDLTGEEHALIEHAKLLQFVTAGVDFVPLGQFPPKLPIAFNGGGYSEPMAEHCMAMVLAAAKRLFTEHNNLTRGEFNQFVPNRLLAGGTAGILGFGGIGKACARLLRAFGMSIHAINRRGDADGTPGVDWCGTPDKLDELLTKSDVLVVSLPLTKSSRNLIGARELSLMKPNAILVNLARGEIVNEAAFFKHLQNSPDFVACIDAWWVEPVRHNEFRMDQPFMTLSNVIASPHNSATTPGWATIALGRAVGNCRRVIQGQAPLHLIGDDERVA